MPAYQIIVQGSGIEVPSDDETVVGFFTTRIAWGQTPDIATKKAFQAVSKEWRNEKYGQANLGNMPELTCDRIKEISWTKAVIEMQRKGYIFYPNR